MSLCLNLFRLVVCASYFSDISLFVHLTVVFLSSVVVSYIMC